MKPLELRHIFRRAVVAALPLALQTACTPAPANTNAQPSVQPVAAVSNDRCFLPAVHAPIENTPIHMDLATLSKPLSFEECVSRCEQFARSINVIDWGVVRLGPITTHQCSSVSGPQGAVDCTISADKYIAEYSGAPGCPGRPTPQPVVGRMPAGLHIAPQVAQTAVGRYFADMACMETAAITAFSYLVRELEAYQAPAELIQLARDAIREETEHADMAGLLSAAFQTTVPAVVVEPFQLRPLAEIALENAVEGCVNETFAAACGLWQSEHAGLETFRAVIGRITEEEIRHAELSWAIHAWVMPQLSAAEQAHIRTAQTDALARLEADFDRESDPVLCQVLGLPQRDEAVRLVRSLRDELWDVRLAA